MGGGGTNETILLICLFSYIFYDTLDTIKMNVTQYPFLKYSVNGLLVIDSPRLKTKNIAKADIL